MTKKMKVIAKSIKKNAEQIKATGDPNPAPKNTTTTAQSHKKESAKEAVKVEKIAKKIEKVKT
jgi:hypothetical protein